MTAIDSLELASRGLQELESIETYVSINTTKDKFRELKSDLDSEYDNLEWIISTPPVPIVEFDEFHKVNLHGVQFAFYVRY